MDIFNYSDYEVTVVPIFDGMEKKAIRRMREEEETRVILPQGCQTIPTYPSKIVRYKFTFKYGQIDVEIDKGKEVKQTSRKVVYNPVAEVLGNYMISNKRLLIANIMD